MQAAVRSGRPAKSVCCSAWCAKNVSTNKGEFGRTCAKCGTWYPWSGFMGQQKSYCWHCYMQRGGTCTGEHARKACEKEIARHIGMRVTDWVKFKACQACGQHRPLSGFQFRRDTMRFRPDCKLCKARDGGRRLSVVTTMKCAAAVGRRGCRACIRIRPDSEPGGSSTMCAACARRYAEQNPDGIRRARLKKYGLSIAEYRHLMESQGGACASCGDEMEKPHVDHCHDTGMVRGILCRACNLAEGFMRGDPARAMRLADYMARNAAAKLRATA